ncbi:MAG: hypothetical protein PHI05_02555 [Bacilli bacterium]|nr:hypothetical protein [Bacilli bacterium]MDD4547605.1 hypothetical protein [Bacilli bacterium]
MKNVFKSLKYVGKYMIFMWLPHTMSKIGTVSIYSYSILIIPVINYLALLWGVFRPISKTNELTKQDVFIPFLIISSITNILFFYFSGYNNSIIFMVVITNIIEFIIMKPEKEKIDNQTKKNIDNYFKNHDR